MEKSQNIKQKIDEELSKFSAIRKQYNKIISARGQLEIQLNENKIVKEVRIIIFMY